VVGVTDDGSAARLASAIDTGATALGFESESRDYVPHLTVARLRDAGAARSADDLVKAHGDVAFGAVPVKEIGLYESVLDRNGAIYRRVEAFQLMRGCV
jgi:2'-5' RNA ligase